MSLVQEHGLLKSLWHLHLTCYYPLSHIAVYFLGWWGFRLLALSSILVLTYYCIRFYGRILGTVISSGVIVLLGNIRTEAASSTGTAYQFPLLIIALLFLTVETIRKRDIVVLIFFSFVTGLSGLVAPFYLLKYKNFKFFIAAILVGLTLLFHVQIKKYMPSDTPQNYSKLLSRKVSFDPVIWLSVLNVQSISSLIGDTTSVRQVSSIAVQVSSINPKTYFIFGASSLGWMLLLLGGGWRFAVAVLCCSAMCVAFSAPNIKMHMAIYPDHAHYLHWVSGCLWVGLMLGFNKFLNIKYKG